MPGSLVPGGAFAGMLGHPQNGAERDRVHDLLKQHPHGLHSLACIFQDERGQIQALPLYLRRQIARRLQEALGPEAFLTEVNSLASPP